ncbi:MAG: 3 protein, partial [Actinomycetota bacterium]|nr:3 protein [Actinomycetota bacterium]
GTLQGALAAIGVPAESTAAAQVAAMDPETNVLAAAHIFADRGWGAWTCGFKQGIVAAIGSTTPGPLNGAYTIGGIDLTPLAPPDWSGSAPAASPAPPATPTPTGPPAGKPKKPRPSLPSPPPGSAPAPSPSVPLPSPTSQSPSPAASTPTATVPASDGAE